MKAYWTKSSDEIDMIFQWLKSEIASIEAVDDVFVIGSILTSRFRKDSDVDIILKVNCSTLDSIRSHSEIISERRKKFSLFFNRSLHITTFNINEIVQFEQFIDVNAFVKI